MSIREQVSDEDLVIVRLNKWFLSRYVVLLLFNKLLYSYPLRINLLDNKYSDLPNDDVKGYEINGSGSLSARFHSL